LLSSSSVRTDGVGAWPWALAPVSIPIAGLTLHKNILRWALIVVPLLVLPLHRHALPRLSFAGLGIHVEFLV
jgi:hypothetical protein